VIGDHIDSPHAVARPGRSSGAGAGSGPVSTTVDSGGGATYGCAAIWPLLGGGATYVLVGAS
jgi:hypothetical protein